MIYQIEREASIKPLPMGNVLIFDVRCSCSYFLSVKPAAWLVRLASRDINAFAFFSLSFSPFSFFKSVFLSICKISEEIVDKYKRVFHC